MQKRTFLIIAIGVLLVFSLNFFQSQVRGFFYSFSAPIQRNLWAVGGSISDFFGGIFRKNDLITENRDLRLQNQELLKKLADSETLREENRALRGALEIGLTDDFQLAFAAVVGKDITRDLILIDKGSAAGLEEGMSVITEQKVLVGKISEVNKNFAKITLVSEKDNSFDVNILGRDVSALLRGRGGQKAYLDRIPGDKTVEKGDVAVSGGGMYPGDLLVGSIVEVQKDDVRPFQEAEISLFFNLRDLRNVFIILK